MLKKKILILSGNNYRGVLKLSLLENSYLHLELTAHFLPYGDYAFLLLIGDHLETFSFDGEKLIKRLSFELDIDGVIECAVIDYVAPYVLMSATNLQALSAGFLYSIRSYAKERLQPKQTNHDSIIATSKAENKQQKQTDNLASETCNQSVMPDNSELNIQNIDANNNSDVTINNLDADMIICLDSKEELESSEKEECCSKQQDSYEQNSFFDTIKNSISEFFDKYPPYKTLSDIVPSSKWVKIDTDDTYYVVGLLYNTSGVTHICYGIPGQYSVKPSSDTLTEWLPLNPEEWEKEGFWMIYQDAQTGQV